MATINPMSPAKKIGPILDKSMSVKNPNTAIDPKITAVIKKAIAIEAPVYARRITESVNPFRKE